MLPKKSNAPVYDILGENPIFNIRRTPVSSILSGSATFNSLADDQKLDVDQDLKRLATNTGVVSRPRDLQATVTLWLVFCFPNLQHSRARICARVLPGSRYPSRPQRAQTCSYFLHEERRFPHVNTAGSARFGVARNRWWGIQSMRRKASGHFCETLLEAKTQVTLERLFGSLDDCVWGSYTTTTSMSTILSAMILKASRAHSWSNCSFAVLT